MLSGTYMMPLFHKTHVSAIDSENTSPLVFLYDTIISFTRCSAERDEFAKFFLRDDINWNNYLTFAYNQFFLSVTMSIRPKRKNFQLNNDGTRQKPTMKRDLELKNQLVKERDNFCYTIALKSFSILHH